MNALPLSRASLCADCDTISDAPHDECPACTSHSLMSLAVVLGTNAVTSEPSGLAQRLSQSLSSACTHHF